MEALQKAGTLNLSRIVILLLPKQNDFLSATLSCTDQEFNRHGGWVNGDRIYTAIVELC